MGRGGAERSIPRLNQANPGKERFSHTNGSPWEEHSGQGLSWGMPVVCSEQIWVRGEEAMQRHQSLVNHWRSVVFLTSTKGRQCRVVNLERHDLLIF